jgi:hypothetical protein
MSKGEAEVVVALPAVEEEQEEEEGATDRVEAEHMVELDEEENDENEDLRTEEGVREEAEKTSVRSDLDEDTEAIGEATEIPTLIYVMLAVVLVSFFIERRREAAKEHAS